MGSRYSGRSLMDKLGIRAGMRVFINASAGHLRALEGVEEDVYLSGESKGPLDLILFFTKDRSELENKLSSLKRELSRDGALWVSWPKDSSGVKTDLNEGVVREIGLRHGLVDVKVASIDEVWSGLKFVYRLKDRIPHS